MRVFISPLQSYTLFLLFSDEEIQRNMCNCFWKHSLSSESFFLQRTHSQLKTCVDSATKILRRRRHLHGVRPLESLSQGGRLFYLGANYCSPNRRLYIGYKFSVGGWIYHNESLLFIYFIWAMFAWIKYDGWNVWAGELRKLPCWVQGRDRRKRSLEKF